MSEKRCRVCGLIVAGDWTDRRSHLASHNRWARTWKAEAVESHYVPLEGELHLTAREGGSSMCARVSWHFEIHLDAEAAKEHIATYRSFNLRCAGPVTVSAAPGLTLEQTATALTHVCAAISDMLNQVAAAAEKTT